MRFVSKKQLLWILGLFLATRLIFVTTFNWFNGPYHHEMVLYQFLIADAKWHGHDFAYDRNFIGPLVQKSEATHRTIPIEEFDQFERNPHWERFPARDLPGYGYLIYYTSKLFGDKLSSRYAFAIQIGLELASLLLFVSCVSTLLSPGTAFLFALVYLIGFPFIQLIAGQAIRDMFGVFIYALLTWTLSYFAFARKLPRSFYPMAGAIISLSAALLWFRPGAYYYFVLVAGVAVLAFRRRWWERAVFAAAVLVASQVFFSLPFADFNQRHYGVRDTKFIAWGLWGGLGTVKDNPYGFVFGDRDLLAWAKNRIPDPNLQLGDIRINQLAWDYAIGVLKKDPLLFFKAVWARAGMLATTPLSFDYWQSLVWRGPTGLSPWEYIQAHPRDFLHYGFRIYGRVFFYSALACLLGMVIWSYRRGRDPVFLCILTLPLAYHLVQFFLYIPERRHFLSGAWVLCLPLAWALDQALHRLRSRRANVEKA